MCIVQIIYYMNNQFHYTYITLVLKTVHNVYFITSSNLLCAYNLYNILYWLNQPINFYSCTFKDQTFLLILYFVFLFLIFICEDGNLIGFYHFNWLVKCCFKCQKDNRGVIKLLSVESLTCVLNYGCHHCMGTTLVVNCICKIL